MNPEPGTDSLRAVVHAALLTRSPLARYWPGQMRQARHDHMTLLARAEVRHVQVFGPETPEHVFVVAAEFFGDAGGFTIEIEVGVAPALEDAFRVRGWHLYEEEPALVLLDPPATAPPPPEGLSIHPVASERDLLQFRSLSSLGSRWVPSLVAATDPAVGLFLGEVAGEPVASSRLVCLNKVAEITSVITAPAFRRRGYGTALTWAAAVEGVRRGCTAAMLTATAMGYPVYLRMGFRLACTFRTYIPSTNRATHDSDT
jgi:ribosomal protein S18 acetylase RimI-like enzyme